MTQITVDPEFAGLIPPLQADELDQLKASIMADGCRDALVVWKGHNILVDGHNRYKICQDNGIEFRVTEREFVDRSQVTEWMIRNQLARRNISLYVRSELALQLETVISERAKDNQGARTDLLQNSVKSEPVHTQKELAKIAETSHDTIRKVKKVSESAPDSIKKRARSGDISINRADLLTRALEKSPVEYREQIVGLAGDSDEKIYILNRLHHSAGSIESNGTFFEIVNTGGFHYGRDMKLHCDFKTVSIQTIQRALDDIAKQHAIIEMERQKAEQEASRAQTAIQILEKTDIADYVHGDCLTLLSALPDNSIRLLLTDPPYGVDFQSNRRTASAKADKIAGDESPQDAAMLLRDMLQSVVGKMADDSRILVFTSQAYYSLFRAIITEAGYTSGRTLTWLKENHGSGNLQDFAPQTEWIINAWRGKPSISHRISDVLDYRREHRTTHPTEKPTQLMMDLIKVLTLPDELVVDPFAGTGVTVEAARRLGRKAYGIEKSKTWYDEGIVRLEGVQRKAA